MNSSIQTSQQLSQMDSQSNFLDFLGPDNVSSQKLIDNMYQLKDDSLQKPKRKKFLIARKVQPNNMIETIQEDGEQDCTPSNQGKSDQHNIYNNNNPADSINFQNRINQVTGSKNNELNASYERNGSQDARQNYQDANDQSLNVGIPNLNNLPSMNMSLNNSQYIPGYTPQNNTGNNVQQYNQKKNTSPYNNKSIFDRPSAFQQYLKEKEITDQPNHILSAVIKSSNLNDSLNQNINLSGIDECSEAAQSPQKDKNIFLKHNKPLHLLQIGENGPRIDNYGHIIPRSIVGKPEWYLKNQGSKLTKEDLNMFSPKKTRFQTSQSISVKSRSVQRSTMKHLPKIIQDVKITKFQLEKELDVIRQRIKDNIQAENKSIKDLKTTDHIRYTQQQRNLQKFEEVEKQWMNFIEQSSSKLNRDYSQSQLLSQDVYRQKREMTDVFETAKGAFDLFGQRVWYMNLRNPQEEQKPNPNEGDYKDIVRSKSTFNLNPLVVLEDFPLAFNRALPQGMMKRQLEIVRKPLVTNLNQSLKMSKSITQNSINQSQISSQPFKSFDSIQYYNQRLNDLRDDLKFHKKVLIEQQMDIDNLAIVGVSQLQREQDMLYNSHLEMFDHKKAISEPYTEEIIEMNYDKQGIQHEGTLKNFTLPQINRSSLDYSIFSKS